MADGRSGGTEPTLPRLRTDRGEVDVLVIGSYFCDLVYSGLASLPLIGEEIWASDCAVLPGGTYITAAALHRLGVSCAWSTRFGGDPFSRFVLESARAEGLNEAAFTEIDAPLRNISVSLSLGGERSFVSYAEPTERQTTNAIFRLRPRIVIRPGLGSVAEMAEFVAAAHAVGALMFVDPQSTSHTLASPEVRDLLADLDVFAPNEREARLMSGATDASTAVDVLTAATRFVLLKLGPAGAVAADKGSAVFSPAFPTTPLETTGAGDCFNAGFVMAMLEGASIAECLAAGNAAGSLSTRAPSSLGMPTRSEVDALRFAAVSPRDRPVG